MILLIILLVIIFAPVILMVALSLFSCALSITLDALEDTSDKVAYLERKRKKQKKNKPDENSG